MTKVNIQNWSQLDFLINNFYEIVEYKRGRGIYGDRVILKRVKQAETLFSDSARLYEFYYMDANAVKELPRTVLEKVKAITRFVITPEDMNVLCDFETQNGVEPTEWAVETEKLIFSANTLDFKVLNNILINRYKTLESSLVSKLKKHREKQYFLASSEAFNFISKEYAAEQISIL